MTEVNQELTQLLTDKTVLLTGAAGFLGSHLAATLLMAGAKVIGVDNFITGSEANLAEVAAELGEKMRSGENWWFIEADVSQDPTRYLSPEILAATGPVDLVLHFASPASPPRYQAKPVETYLVNSMGTHSLLQWLKQSNSTAKFLFASTSEVYGDPEQHPQSESYWGNVNPNGVRSCYDEGKRLGETICGVHERDFGMDVRIVRIFNTYGPRIDLTDGRVVPNFIQQALAQKPLTIYGTGTQTRSYCYVNDLVRGILLLAMRPGLKGKTINIGNPEEYSLLDTAKAVFAAVTGREAQETDFTFKPLPGDDPTRRKPDIHQAAELLNWRPEISFADGLKETVAYFRRKVTNS
jgi:nucleoside-diphosphate-sugar epimerase